AGRVAQAAFAANHLCQCLLQRGDAVRVAVADVGDDVRHVDQFMPVGVDNRRAVAALDDNLIPCRVEIGIIGSGQREGVSARCVVQQDRLAGTGWTAKCSLQRTVSAAIAASAISPFSRVASVASPLMPLGVGILPPTWTLTRPPSPN